MTWRQMIAVGVRRVVLARGEFDKLEWSKICREEGQSCAERREKPREQGIGKAAAASQDLREGVEDVEWRAL